MSFEFRNLTKENADEWFIAKGFAKQTDGSWRKPKRAVPRLCETSRPKPQHVDRETQDDVAPREATYPGCVLVCVTSYRRRLLDDDNLLAKYFVDCCRYSGLIRNDCPGIARIVTKQERVSKKAQEGTEIVITPL